VRRKALCVCAVLVTVAACTTSRDGTRGGAIAPLPYPAAAAAGVEASVTRVVDGDTIVVALDDPGGSRVRLIGIDTPERDDCMYRAATDHMRSLVEGKRVRLTKDVSETDRYGRLLRYVYVEEVFVNAAMVIEGYAAAATFPPDVAHATELASFERDARSLGRGLWSGICVP
jgi:endonuclease YncB( thermonuclease family)